ncbi:hypothetical protein P0F08_002673 [Vibrio metschnikovii]|uniref:Uncharacterized protein n=1 Tax=bacterium 19MO02SH05 TaxID=2920696 RepID=A0AAU6TQG3_UNCXX|nr:hypothetical protein [Vibrio metschnikovii]EKO3718456.1 hypothetical protein [Vibrio metschnikovii]
MRTAINTCLTLLILMMIFLSSLAFASDAACPIGYDMGSRSWDGSIYGDRPYMCFQTNRCKARPHSVSLCFVTDTTCVSNFLTTGEQCTETESSQSGTIFPGGDIVTPPDNGGGDGSDGGGSDGGDGGGSDDNKGMLPNAPSVGPVIINRNGVTDLSNAVQGVVNSSRTSAQYIERAIYNQTHNLYEIGRENNNLQKAVIQNQNTLENTVSTGFTIVSQQENTQTQQLIAIRDRLTTSSNQDNSFYDESYVYQARQLSQNDTLINRADTTNQRLDNVKQTLDNNFSTFMNFFARKMDSLESAILSGGSGESNVNMHDLTQLVSDALQANQMHLNQQTDAITGSISGLGTDLKGIKDALTTKFDERAFVGKVDFDVDGVLYKSSLYNDLFIEREQLEQEYEQLLDKVKNMFSLDTSQLNTGDYKDHILDFLAPDGSGRQFSFKSGVFPAFIQQANLIATILLFIAAVIAVRVIMGGSK